MVTKKERKAILDFLGDLGSNNHREWFEANRPRYETARASFLSLVGELIDRFDAVDDLDGVTVKECVFRINRDVRFAKDKSPYKTAMSAVLGRSGRKSGVRSYYFHVEAAGTFLAGGLYDPSPTSWASSARRWLWTRGRSRRSSALRTSSATSGSSAASRSRRLRRAIPRTIPTSISCARSSSWSATRSATRASSRRSSSLAPCRSSSR